MDQRPDDRPLDTSLFRAIEKNKIVRNQLVHRQRAHSIQLAIDLKSHHVQERYNRELLHSWKQEAYQLQLKQRIRSAYNVDQARYGHQVKNLQQLISGQPGQLVPSSEEQRRSDVKAKYQQFLRSYPLQTIGSRRTAHTDAEHSEDDGEDLARNIEETWKHIHAQSAMWSKRKQATGLPALRRSRTLNEMRRMSILPTYARGGAPANERSRFRTNHFELCESVESAPPASDLLERMNHTDLFVMRSVRRPRQNSTDLNALYEARKRVYQMNKRVMDSRVQ